MPAIDREVRKQHYPHGATRQPFRRPLGRLFANYMPDRELVRADHSITGAAHRRLRRRKQLEDAGLERAASRRRFGPVFYRG
jgi:hypothetical protein